MVGLISNNDEMHYREEVAQLAEWCGTNNLSLNVGKTKEVMLDFRRNSVDHPPLTIDSSTGTTAPTLSPPAEKSKSPSTHPHHILRAPLRVCWPAASLSGTGTVVQQTARSYSGQWTQLQRSSVPLSHPSWTFSLHDAPAKPTASWRTPPIPPTVSSSSYHQEDGTGASEPPDCSTAFSPRLWEPWTQITPPPPLKPHANPYLLNPPLQPPPPPPTLPHQRKKLYETFCAIRSVLHTGVWACTNHL